MYDVNILVNIQKRMSDVLIQCLYKGELCYYKLRHHDKDYL